ncbi:hypothetical protein AUK40_04330 [Candidatus Wirthbacteria bacterium CG2_30_54_11]|uniref:UmuC domain-containing protein n=1 Tax=Candidatus Wirthbacteria bacterium CG2_30_54_11 TaxID=1817892 RepID=A0A1J5IUQ5_9BACT|nr:MAG: hypothetical protein AUK40_04330 [Candidatus Wirthbacteria bacterium CG2_30_54_11]
MKWPQKNSEVLPRAVVHVCIENLYASIASRDRTDIRERPFVTGGEGTLVTSSNHLAAGLGIQKGMTISDALEIYPSLEVVPTDLEGGESASEAMFEAMRQFSHRVEESGLHRGFADLSRSDGYSITSYETVARELAIVIQRRIGLEVRLGLSLNRTLSAIACNAGAAGGVTMLPRRFIPLFLRRTSVSDIPGMATNQAARLRHVQICTAGELFAQSASRVQQLLGRSGVDLWKELQGEQVFQISQTTADASIFQSYTHGGDSPAGTSKKARSGSFVFPSWLDLNLAFSRWHPGARV